MVFVSKSDIIDTWWCINIILLISLSLSKWAEYTLFACLLLAVCVIFSVMAHFYTYIDPVEIEAEFKKKLNENDNDRDDEMELQETMDVMDKRDSDQCSEETKQTKIWTV